MDSMMGLKVPVTMRRRNDPLREVIDEVAAYFEIPVERLTNVEWRDRTTIAARKVAAWMLCERFPYASVTTISRLLGYRERSGASHAVAYLERRIASDIQLRIDIDVLRARPWTKTSSDEREPVTVVA